MNNVRFLIIIEGRVQGVWFRDSTRKEALSLGVTGWVKNRPDGTVEVLAEGPEDKVRALIGWCHHGPPSAGVTRLDETEELWEGRFETFDIVF